MATRWDYLSLGERFWEKVEWSPGCWEWVARRNASGYGTFQLAARKSRDGECNSQAKLSLVEVVALRAAVADGMNAAAAGRLFGISRSAATRIVRGKTWKHAP